MSTSGIPHKVSFFNICNVKKVLIFSILSNLFHIQLNPLAPMKISSAGLKPFKRSLMSQVGRTVPPIARPTSGAPTGHGGRLEQTHRNVFLRMDVRGWNFLGLYQELLHVVKVSLKP